jgi:putative ABC transport system permease protein
LLKNYLLLALRVIRRNKLYSLINVGCLAIGIAVAMTVMVYVLHEHSYDKWHANAKRIFAITTLEKFGSASWQNYQLSYLTGSLVRRTDPSVESMVRTFPGMFGLDLQNPDQPGAHFSEDDRFRFADSNFFSFFSFRLLRGRKEMVLARPFTLVLTERAAKKYFGVADPVGRILVMEGKYRMEVTGVVADLPSNSSIQFDFLSSLSTLGALEKYKPFLKDQQVHRGMFNTWLLLRDPGDVPKVERSLEQLSVKPEEKDLEASEHGYGHSESHQYKLQPLADGHLKNFATMRKMYLDLFTLVGALILLLAVVNYMSLATARSSIRAKEVGVRKVLGAGRPRLAEQFYIESGVFALFSFLLAIPVFWVFRVYFFRLIDVPVDNHFLVDPIVIWSFLGLLVLVILVSGSYPALVLSGFKPVAVLYGRMSRRVGGERVRKGFIVLQFTISMGLVTGSFVVGKQLYYLRHKETGVDRENVVMLPFGSTLTHYAAYQHEVAALPGVSQVATTYYKLFTGGTFVQTVEAPGKSPESLSGIVVDRTFIPLLGLKWKEEPKAGDLFGKNALVLNEAAVEKFGLGVPATGKTIKANGTMMRIAGVLKNFNHMSLRRDVEPFSVTVMPDAGKEWDSSYDGGCMYVKIGAHVNIPTTMEAIHQIYKKFDQRKSFEVQFLDEAFNDNYKMDERLQGVINLATLITIVIACLGLFGLATFSAQQRMREIGIRKVLGASVASIGALLSRDFLRPVLLAIGIACPVSWWVMHKWLEDFAYRTSLSWWIFGVAALGLVLVALGTVLSRSCRAARANPVENLRAE